MSPTGLMTLAWLLPLLTAVLVTGVIIGMAAVGSLLWWGLRRLASRGKDKGRE